MKNVIFSSVLFLTAAPAMAVEYHTEVTVDPTYQGHKIYVGSGAGDIPAGVGGLLTDAVCKGMGYLTSSHAKTEFIKITEPTTMAFPITGDNDTVVFATSTLDPQYSKSAAYLSELGCYKD